MLLILRIAIVALVAQFFAILALYAYVQFQWSATMPKQPDPIAGRTHPVTVNHGDHVFVSAQELRSEWLLTAVGFPLGFTGFAVASMLNEKHRPFSKSRS